MAEETKPYLEYLDKEMTIMGLLSTFDVLVLGLTLNSSLGEHRGELQNVWSYGHWYLVGGSFWMLVAALLFYRQRSLLAYYYGQIALCGIQGRSGEYDDLKSVLVDADAWTTWFFYQVAFACTVVGFLSFGLALLSIDVPVIRGPRVTVVTGLISVAVTLGFSLWNRQRLRRMDEGTRENRRKRRPGGRIAGAQCRHH